MNKGDESLLFYVLSIPNFPSRVNNPQDVDPRVVLGLYFLTDLRLKSCFYSVLVTEKQHEIANMTEATVRQPYQLELYYVWS